MRFSKAVNAVSVACCSALIMGGFIPRAQGQFLKAIVRAATEEEIQEMRDNGELPDDDHNHNAGHDDDGRELQSFPQPTDFWDIVEFEITNSCGSEEDIKEDLEDAYERYYRDLLDDTLAMIPGCGEDEPKNTTSFTLLFWEEALECDPYYRRRRGLKHHHHHHGDGNALEGVSNNALEASPAGGDEEEELLRKRRKSRGRGRRRGKCNGCNRRRMEETKTFVIDLSGGGRKDRRLQDCTADLGAELQQVPGFGRTRVAVNVDEPAACEVGSEDCDFPSEACCGSPGCYCATPGVSECESEGCCLCNAVPFDPNFCRNVGSCDSDPCNVVSGPDPCAPPTSVPTVPPSSEPSEAPTPMVDICPAEDPQTTTDIAVAAAIGETYVLDLTTETTTDDQFSCVSGCLTLSNLAAPYNILFNLDVSGSTAGAILEAEIDSTINFVQDLVDTDALDNSNVNFALITFESTATFLGEFNISDPNNSSAIDPTLLGVLNGLRGYIGGGTDFKDALSVSVSYFQNATAGRSNVMYFLSDGDDNYDFMDEVDALEALNTTRFAIGILQDPDDIETLDKIDSSGKAKAVQDTDELSDLLLNNGIVGEPVDFRISVNGVPEPGINVSALESSPLGYFFGDFELDGLNPTMGFINNVTAYVVMDISGHNVTVTSSPTEDLTASPTISPTESPNATKTPIITQMPSAAPTMSPTGAPTMNVTNEVVDLMTTNYINGTL